jgi:CDP-diacylglycerol--glycerol-3-phosphate 3-phosphatidyltransferase
VRGWLAPLAHVLARLGVSANVLTLVGFALVAVGAFWFARGRFVLGALLALAGSLGDAVDGAVARERGEVSAFGAFLDSTVDRVSDTLLFLGIALYYFYLPVLTSSSVSRVLVAKVLNEDPVINWLVGFSALLALAGSYMVSYTRARAEGLGVDCRAGWFERPERLIVLLGAGLFGVSVVMEFALFFLAIMTWFTVVQRVLYVRRRLAQAPLPPGAGAA